MSLDPVVTNPEHYRTIFENEEVRVLEYTDEPGDATALHAHPDSLMYTLTSFTRRLFQDDQVRDVELPAGEVVWLPAQQHHACNTGQTPTRAIFVEMKHPAVRPPGDAGVLGPA
ncbi:cupin domain-containing protein [Cellulomonas sp. P22]|uniref:cupin domain-containing protein n=1 Tax=Cellulomonas sp. P22 TaxID=3373189 RepID=UPI0037B2230C